LSLRTFDISFIRTKGSWFLASCLQSSQFIFYGDQLADVATDAKNEHELTFFIEKKFADHFGPDKTTIFMYLPETNFAGWQTGKALVDYFKTQRKGLLCHRPIFSINRFKGRHALNFFGGKPALAKNRRTDINKMPGFINNPVNILGCLENFAKKIHAASQSSERVIIHLFSHILN
jgi:hypothetical protein